MLVKSLSAALLLTAASALACPSHAAAPLPPEANCWSSLRAFNERLSYIRITSGQSEAVREAMKLYDEARTSCAAGRSAEAADQIGQGIKLIQVQR
jgi:hypothetical protein